MNYIVCGPPGSGKTTYVRERINPGDIVVDIDAMFQAFTFLPVYQKPTNLLSFIFDVQRNAIEKIALNDDNMINNAWIIIAGARSVDREYLRAKLDAKIVMLDVPADECLRRVYADESRRGKGIAWGKLIKDWWDHYD